MRGALAYRSGAMYLRFRNVMAQLARAVAWAQVGAPFADRRKSILRLENAILRQNRDLGQSASECQPRTARSGSRKPLGRQEVGSHLPFRTWAFQPVQKTATIHVSSGFISSGFIWGIPAYCAKREFFVPLSRPRG